MILKLNFWSFFSLHITFYQRLDDRMQAEKAKNALERPISVHDARVAVPVVGKLCYLPEYGIVKYPAVLADGGGSKGNTAPTSLDPVFCPPPHPQDAATIRIMSSRRIFNNRIAHP
jgi:hypothetical protein